MSALFSSAFVAIGNAQSHATIIYVATGHLSGTTTAGINGDDASNMRTLGAMVQSLNQNTAYYTYNLVQVGSFTSIAAYQNSHPEILQVWVAAHSNRNSSNGLFEYTDPLTGQTDITLSQLDGSPQTVRDAVSQAQSSSSDFFYCGMYGDESEIDADDMGAVIARHNYQSYTNVTQKGAMDPSKSGGKANSPTSGGSGGATVAPTAPNQGIGGYWQVTTVDWSTWYPDPNTGGGVLVGSTTTSYEWFPTGTGNGTAPGNTVLN